MGGKRRARGNRRRSSSSSSYSGNPFVIRSSGAGSSSQQNNQTGQNKEMVLWVYLMKHIDGIASYLRGHRSEREEVQGRLTDAIVYLCILWGMIESGEK